MSAGTTEFFAGFKTPTMGINGTYLGPTIRCRAGDEMALEVENALGEPTTVHWHGVHVPARHDGGPHQVIAPGATWQPRFKIRQKAATCWYHSHLMGRTGFQVLHGLAGLLLIDDPEAADLPLPKEYGVDDIPLIIQDRRFTESGAFAYLASMHDVMMGFLGDTLLVNGTVSPYLQLKRSRTRLRILNGSNARFYNLGRDDAKDLVVIASDGGLLETPVRTRRLRLAPGERAEVLIEAEPDTSFVLTNFPDASRGSSGMMMGSREFFPVMELRSGRLEDNASPLPPRLSVLPAWRENSAARTRTFTLSMGMMGMGRGMMMGRGRGHGRGTMGINGRAMDLGRIDERVPAGAVEIWEVRNDTPLAHPFHIHDIQFRILDRQGSGTAPHERGLKDTVVVEPGSTARVIARFGDYVDPASPYMYHCHILEHEDAGMMGQFVMV